MTFNGQSLQPASSLIGRRVRLGAGGCWVTIDELWMDWNRRRISHALVHADDLASPWLVSWKDIDWRSGAYARASDSD